MKAGFTSVKRDRWGDEQPDSHFFARTNIREICKTGLNPSPPIRHSLESPFNLAEVFKEFAESVHSKAKSDLRIGILEKVVMELRQKVSHLESRCETIVPINTLDDAKLRIKSVFYIHVMPDENEYQAVFGDANLNATGETRFEAIENLKDLIVTNFKFFSSLGVSKLGPMPRKQLRAMSEFIEFS